MIDKQLADKFRMTVGMPHERPTGQELFDSLSREEQDELLGPEKAQLVRDGKVELSDFVQRNPQDEGPDFVTAKPLQDVDPDA